MDLSKLNLPPDVRPRWSDGIPGCTAACPSCSPVRQCLKTGYHQLQACYPAIAAMAQAVPGLLSCERCKGSGTVAGACSDPQCGDSTWDHDCDDGRKIPCPRCLGTGKAQGAGGA